MKQGRYRQDFRVIHINSYLLDYYHNAMADNNILWKENM